MLNVAVSVVQKHNHYRRSRQRCARAKRPILFSMVSPAFFSLDSLSCLPRSRRTSSVVKLPQSYIIELSALLLFRPHCRFQCVVVTAWPRASAWGATPYSATLAGIVYGFCYPRRPTYARKLPYADPLLALTVGLALCFAFGEDNISQFVWSSFLLRARYTRQAHRNLVLAPVLFFYFLGRRPRSSWAIVAEEFNLVPLLQGFSST